MAGDGGKRPGAGRPKGAVSEETRKAQEFKKYLIKKMLEEKGEIVKALIEKSKKGDVVAIKESLDRVLGKAQQAVDITSKGEKIGEPLTDSQKARLATELQNAD